MITIYINVVDGYVADMYSSTRSTSEEIEIILDESHPFFTSDFACWKYVDGELIFDEEKRQQREEDRIEEENKLTETDMLAMAIMDLTELIMGGIE